MAISTLAELKTAIADWDKRGDLTNYLDNLILIGEKWIFRKCRSREMETALSVTISNGVATLPTDFLALKSARISGQNVSLKIRPASWIYEQYPMRSGSGVPEYIGVDGGNFVFGPYPGTYTIIGTYFAQPTSIISSANALFLAHPDLYLFACLAESQPFLRRMDNRIALWTGKRDEILKDVNEASEESKFGDAMAVALG